MTRYTKAYDLLGKTEFRVTITVVIPLADPKAWGNMGLEGYDEDFHNVTRASLVGAKKYVTGFVKKTPNCTSLLIERGHWVPNDFDWDGELIRDAEFEIQGVIDGYVANDDGTIYYFEERKPDRWEV